LDLEREEDSIAHSFHRPIVRGSVDASPAPAPPRPHGARWPELPAVFPAPAFTKPAPTFPEPFGRAWLCPGRIAQNPYPPKRCVGNLTGGRAGSDSGNHKDAATPTKFQPTPEWVGATAGRFVALNRSERGPTPPHGPPSHGRRS